MFTQLWISLCEISFILRINFFPTQILYVSYTPLFVIGEQLFIGNSHKCVKKLLVKVKTLAIKSNLMISVYFYYFYCEEFILRLPLYTIISYLVILDVFGQFYVVARYWSKSHPSSTMRFVVTVVNDFQPIAIVKKCPVWKTDVALDPLLAASDRLSTIKGVGYIVMQRRPVKFLSQYTSGFGYVWWKFASSIQVLFHSIFNRFFGFYFLSFWTVSHG